MEKELTSKLLAYSTAHLLSIKEKEVLVLMALGLNSKESSIKLDVLPKSIDNYKNRISKKLGLKGYGALCSFAIDNKDILLEWNLFLFSSITESTTKLSDLLEARKLPSEEMGTVSGGHNLNLMYYGRKDGSLHPGSDFSLNKYSLIS
jgi:DNA-binding CsgD family transcriptional regulator